MKFSAVTKNIGRLAAGTTAAFTLAVGMVMPASAMSTTAATQATQLNHSSQVAELGWGHHHHHHHHHYRDFDDDFGWGSDEYNDNSVHNSVRNCRSNSRINNIGGIVFNTGTDC